MAGPLGKKVSNLKEFSPDILFPIKREEQRESRKDDRIKQEGTQQSKMIQQRQTDSPAIDFEAEPEMDMTPFM